MTIIWFRGISKLKFLSNKFLQAKFPNRIELVARKEMDPTTNIGIWDLIAKLSFSLRIMNLKRSLYSTVKTTPNTTVIRTRRLTLFPCLSKAIWCFEKNADVKKRPIEEMKNTLSIEPRIGLFLAPPYSARLSWAPNLFINIAPAVMNSPALNNAWLNRWNNIKLLLDKDKTNIIRPRLDKVELAINFFRSEEKTAQNPPTQRVIPPTTKR